MSTLSTSLTTPYPLLLKPKPPFLQPIQSTTFPPLILSTHSSLSSSHKTIIIQTRPRISRSNAVAVDSESVVSATTDSSTGDGVSTVISLLLFVAFIGLSILTIGVVYLGVTDFLQKRERDKFDKEQSAAASRKKKGGNKAKVRPRTGPKGFGQKIQVEDDD